MSTDIASRLMAGLMADYGLTREQAAGFVGNLAHESAGFKTLQEVSPLVKGARGGYGYAQWTGPRRRAFEAWSQGQGLDPSSFEANYGFLRHELDNTPEGSFLPRLKSAKTVEEAALAVERGFLRPGIPHTDSRIKWAHRVLGGGVPNQGAPQPTTVAQAAPRDYVTNSKKTNGNNVPLPNSGAIRPNSAYSANSPSPAAVTPSATPTAPTVANLLGVDKPRVTALLAALSEQGNEQQQQQQVDPRQMFERNYAWARANGWRV